MIRTSKQMNVIRSLYGGAVEVVKDIPVVKEVPVAKEAPKEVAKQAPKEMPKGKGSEKVDVKKDVPKLRALGKTGDRVEIPENVREACKPICKDIRGNTCELICAKVAGQFKCTLPEVASKADAKVEKFRSRL